MSKQGCYQMYFQENGYKGKGNNSENVILKWVGPEDKALKEKTVVSWMAFHDYYMKNRSNMAVNNALLTHKIANSELFLQVSNEDVQEQYNNTVKAHDTQINLLQQGKMNLMMLSLPKKNCNC